VFMKAAGWMKGPEENRTNVGVWSEASGPFRYGSILLMTIADGLSRPAYLNSYVTDHTR
jgi:hypothetical protein